MRSALVIVAVLLLSLPALAQTKEVPKPRGSMPSVLTELRQQNIFHEKGFIERNPKELHRTQRTCLGIDPAPPQAVAVGFTCETFRDGPFDISEFDTADTRGPGFVWRPGGRTWLNTVQGQWGGAWGGTVVGGVVTDPGHGVPPTWYHIANGYYGFPDSLHLTAQADDVVGQFIVGTAASVGNSGYVGWTLPTGGWYMEVHQTYWGSGFGSSNAAWLVTWTWPLEHTIGGVSSDYAPWIELDHMEGAGANGSGTATGSIHYWAAQHGAIVAHDVALGQITQNNETVGTLLVPTGVAEEHPGVGGGVARLDYYKNGNFTMTSPPTAPPHPEMYDLLAYQHNILFLGSGPANYNEVNTIRIWQSPTETEGPGPGDGGGPGPGPEQVPGSGRWRRH